MIPPRVILAPVDFSRPARSALDFAARLARHTGASLHVLHAQDPLLAEGARHAGRDLARETEDELRLFAGIPSAALPSPPRLHVETGPAVDVIVDVAARVAADVVVVGSHGMSGAERLFFGSTTEGVLRRAPSSVLVTPADWSAVSPATPDLSGTGPVIAAVDFSPAAAAAAKAACRLAVLLRTTLEVVHVVPDLPVLVRWRDQAERAVQTRAAEVREQLESMVASLSCAVAVQARVEQGAVAVRLSDAASPAGSRRPILVLGRRRPGEKGGAPGSTAYRTLTLARVPLLMCVMND